MPRLTCLFPLLLGLAACTAPGEQDRPPPGLGDFRLGHNIVVAPNLVRGPMSREAGKEEWIAAVRSAVAERLDRYEGGRLYHLGISIDGYVLAQPGVPVVAAPKSLLILQVTVWDDAAAEKLNAEPKRFVIFESLSGDTVVGSGLTLTREEQMRNLSRNAARKLQDWLVSQRNDRGWFATGPETAPRADDTAPAPAAESEPADDGDAEAAEAATEDDG